MTVKIKRDYKKLCDKSREELLRTSLEHIDEVRGLMSLMSKRLLSISKKHDHTKIDNIDLFYSDSKEWFENHVEYERHHIDKRVPDDIDLFDVLERIADIVTAGLARSGEVYDDNIPSSVLLLAYKNTVKKTIRECCELID